LSLVLFLSHKASRRGDILAFEKLEKESIGAAWARFSRLLAPSPDWSIPNDISLHIFYTGLDMDSANDLDIAAGGSFVHRTPTEGREILDHILGNSSFVSYACKPEQESQSHLESSSSAEFFPCTSQDSSVEPPPEPQTSKEEEIQPLKFSFQFEDDPYEDLRNTLNYFCYRRPTAPLYPSRKSMNEEWLKEVRRSSKAIQLRSSSTTFYCSIGGNSIEALHDSTVEACIMSEFLMDTFIGSMPLEPTDILF